jgi:hypothetical protein
MREGRFPVAHVPEAKAAVPCGLRLCWATETPTTGALNLMKWEKVVAEGKSDALVVCTCAAMWFLLYARLLFVVAFRLAYSI